ncbi:MAG TPA: hypothetical protein VIA18_10920 [Polyangia bacterium]|jgi:hypothetical protein|nr:hypothetical protein [Polyangia bacterium]
MSEPNPPIPQPPPRRRTFDDPANRSLLGLLFALVLLGIGWVVVEHLSAASKEQDCMMSGRRDCAGPIDTSE